MPKVWKLSLNNSSAEEILMNKTAKVIATGSSGLIGIGIVELFKVEADWVYLMTGTFWCTYGAFLYAWLWEDYGKS